MSLPCLANLDAFWNADPVDVAEAVLQVGFAHRLADPVPMVDFHLLLADLAAPMADVHPGVVRDFSAAPLSLLGQIALESVVLLESRYLAARDSSLSKNMYVVLLRHGRAALESGDVRAALA